MATSDGIRGIISGSTICIAIMSLFLLPLIVFSFLYSYEYENNECSTGFMHLSRWHFGYAIASSGVVGCILIGAMLCSLGFCFRSSFLTLFGIYAAVGPLAAYALFAFAWFIVGGVVLFGNSMPCHDDAYSFFVYSCVLWVLLLPKMAAGFGSLSGLRGRNN